MSAAIKNQKCDGQHIAPLSGMTFSIKVAASGGTKGMEMIMRSRWWNIFDGMVEASFKPVAGGFIYRAPSLLPFVSGTYYKVDQEQKAKLTGYHVNMLAVLFCLIIVAAGIGGPLVD